MADSSSTSSSKPHGNRDDRRAHGLPWALLIAIGIVACVELCIRQLNPSSLIVSRDDSDQARAVRDEISLDKRVDVAFVGSSMTYQGINVPDLQSKLRDAIGKEVIVRNDAIRGGRVDVFASTVRHLLRRTNKPKLIIVGISIRDLREYDLDLERMSIFWTPADLVNVVRERGYSAAQYAPTVIRNEVEPHLSLLKYRNGLSLKLEQLFIDLDTEPMPARGESPSQHLGNRRNEKLSMNEFKSSSNKRRMIQAYRIDLPPTPQEKFVRYVDQIIADCAKANVKLMFVDVPVSEPMQSLIARADKKQKSDQFEPAYRSTMLERCSKGGVPFLTNSDLSIQWTLDDFYDSQHLNYFGSNKMNEALIPFINRAINNAETPSSE